MSKHTEGPWFVWKGHNTVMAGTPKEHTKSFVRGHLGTVAECDDLEFPKAQVKANARLIGAAPDLYRELKAVAGCLVQFRPAFDLADALAERKADILAALAKAEGREE